MCKDSSSFRPAAAAEAAANPAGENWCLFGEIFSSKNWGCSPFNGNIVGFNGNVIHIYIYI